MRSLTPKKITPRKFTIADHKIPKHKAGFIMDTSKGKDPFKGFTLVIAFSRPWCVQNFFAHFHKLYIDMKNCNLLVIDNSDLPFLASELLEKVDRIAHAFNTVRIYKTWRMGGSENVMEDDKGLKTSKIPYIFELHKDMVKMINTDKFVLLEDDTLVPPNSVVRLLQILEENPKCGIATGLETGRSLIAWSKTRIGVHYVHRPGMKLLWRLSPSPYLRGIHKVDACGHYCCASYKDVWLKGLSMMEEGLEGVPRFALDVTHTNNVQKCGYDILADFDLWCKHMQPMGETIYFWERKRARPMLDIWLPYWNVFAQQIILDKPWHKKMLRNLVRLRDRS